MTDVRQGVEFSTLFRAARRREPDALAELHRRYVPPVLVRVHQRLAHRLRRHVDTHDIVQSVFLDLLALIERVEDRGEQAFRHMLYVMAENKLRMRGRRLLGVEVRAKQVIAQQPPAPVYSPSAACSRSEQRNQVRALLHTLKPLDQRIFELRYTEGLTFEAIATQLRLPSAASTRMRHARALVALRQRCKDASIN